MHSTLGFINGIVLTSKSIKALTTIHCNDLTQIYITAVLKDVQSVTESEYRNPNQLSMQA